MSHARWFSFVWLMVLLTACARSSAVGDEAFDDDDEDAGLVGPGDGDDDGGSGAGDASKDAATDAKPADSGNPDGDSNGDSGDVDPACEGVVCDSPPGDVCEDAKSLRTHASAGVCKKGVCAYDSTTEECAYGCDADVCKPNPCIGKTCNNPPANSCLGDELRIYEQVGTCNSVGECSYSLADTITCEHGCSGGKCNGDPCLGVSCNNPPASHCDGNTHLVVYKAPGTCSEGECSYGSVLTLCEYGCANDVCNGDPCEGKVCNSPLASYCDADGKLVVYEVEGTCSSHTGQCSYATVDPAYCEYGCSDGRCKEDPCKGKVCNNPPARNCKDAFTARVYPAEGVCVRPAATCSYVPAEIPCPYGCVNGVCLNCAEDGDCAGGQYCKSNSCEVCDTDSKCGPSCQDCGAGKCHQGSCVECTSDGQCGPGRRCANNACAPCDTAQQCGPSCMSCSGATPACSGGACVCSGNSCGPNQQCIGNACAVCKSQSACGAACSPCGENAPYCLDEGMTSRCVGCNDDSHCSAGDTCDKASRSCVPRCPVTATSVFSDAFKSPNSSTWTTGTDVQVNSTRWRAFTNAKHGVRAYSERLEITNKTSGSPAHGQGYAYVKTGGAGSHYDNTHYEPVLKQNTGREVIWSFNMRRANPSAESTNGGFKCSSSSSQNGITVGVAYVLATNSAADLNAATNTCSATGRSSGYAVVLGGSRAIRLVRFTQGLRNGAITDLITSSNLGNVSNYASVRVTYNAKNDQWKLEVRDDGTSKFNDPNSGSFGSTGYATDATYVNSALEYTGPYFQTGCTGLCSELFDAYFDNLNVAVRCAP